MYSLPRLRAAKAPISLAAATVYLVVVAALVGGLALLHATGGEERPVLDASAPQAIEPAYPVVRSERAPAVVTTDELPEEMAPTF